MHTSQSWFAPVIVALAVVCGPAGCTSFLAQQAMKTYPVAVKAVPGLEKPNHYQSDFLYLKTLCEEVFPLPDRYFPPDQRVPLEREILETLGRPGCSHETFLVSIKRYLAGFNNTHAIVAYNPKPSTYFGLFPFTVHYVSNQLYLVDIAREYDPSVIGRRIIAIDNRPLAEVEQKLASILPAENDWTRRAALEPLGYSRPDFYRITGIPLSSTNSLEIQFADHPPLTVTAKTKGPLEWHRASVPPHPVTARSTHQYDCRVFPEQGFAYLQFNACFDKTAILDGLRMVKPWMRPLVRAYVHTQFLRGKATGPLRGVYDPERPVFQIYIAEAVRDINQRGITNLIIDLRNNPGGETALTYQLLYHLTDRVDMTNIVEYHYNPAVLAYNDPGQSRELRTWYKKEFGTEPPVGQLLPAPGGARPFFHYVTDPKSPYYIAPDRPIFAGRIIVLANQQTGSAASILTGLMQDNHLAEIVGAPTANNPTGPTGVLLSKLPRTGIVVSLPNEYDERADPSRGDILRPDYWVEKSVADIHAGRDPAYEKALELLGRRWGRTNN